MFRPRCIDGQPSSSTPAAGAPPLAAPLCRKMVRTRTSTQTKTRQKSGLPLSRGAWESILDAGAEWDLNHEDLSKMALISS